MTRLTQSLLSYDRTSLITERRFKNIASSYAFVNKRYEHIHKKLNNSFIWDKILEWSSEG